ncbi:hypothetical protein Tco_1445164 [Tanacetum coccineum]
MLTHLQNKYPSSLQPSNAESRLMASRYERDGTSHPVVVRNVRKELCGRREVSGVRRVTRLFRLELDVSDKTASTVVVIFDEPATYFTYLRITSEEVVEEDARSSNREGEKRVDLEDSDEKVTCGMDDGQADGKDSSVSDKRKKNRYIVDDSTSE